MPNGPKTSKIRRKYDILQDNWESILDQDIPSKPIKPNKHIPLESQPHIHRRDIRDWQDGGSICEDTKQENESRSKLHQHNYGSIKVRLQYHPKQGRDGANFHRSIQLMSNRDRRRMTAYNAKKAREVQGTSLV